MPRPSILYSPHAKPNRTKVKPPVPFGIFYPHLNKICVLLTPFVLLTKLTSHKNRRCTWYMFTLDSEDSTSLHNQESNKQVPPQ